MNSNVGSSLKKVSPERQCIDGFVTFDGTRPVTTSRAVAEKFGKRHDNVLRAYDRLDCSEEFNRLNYEVVAAQDRKGEMRRELRMTKDGFMFLVMGFMGGEAARIKEAYIRAFNDMAQVIAGSQASLWQQMQALIAREVESKVRASFGSRLMLVRKSDIKRISTERERLEAEIQPELVLIHVAEGA